jgi:DMSO/TMAO reductase YedYZ heme-binding membrane subunit
MHELLHNIRFYILLLSIVFSLVVNIIIITTIPAQQLQTIRLNQIYGLASVILLYLALLAGPFCYMFATFPWKKQYLKARRALGVSAFYFASLHSLIAFFGQLNGFDGLGFLTNNYLIALSASFIALFILMLQAMTSFDAVIEKMTFPRWKILQRFVYLAGILTLVHVVMLGTHFQDLASPIARTAFIALAFLFFLEALRIDSWLQNRFKIAQKFSYGSLFIGGLLITGIIFLFTPFASRDGVSFGVHQKHSSQQTTAYSSSSAMDASMQGDESLRFTVSLDKPEIILPNQDTTLSFSVYNAANGSIVPLFQKFYEKESHLVVTDNTLQYFNHIHPERDKNIFTITTRFPKPGVYRTYLTYQPIGAIEQQVAFSFMVGTKEATTSAKSEQIIDAKYAKVFGQHEITIDTTKPLKSAAMTDGSQTIPFRIKDALSKEPTTNLKPYLGAFGHLVMINTEDYSYLHVHPLGDTPKPNQNGGPEVIFQPMTLTDQIKPGVYRVFAEFNPAGQYIVADYTMRVE